MKKSYKLLSLMSIGLLFFTGIVFATEAESYLEHLTDEQLASLLNGEQLRSGSETGNELQLLIPGSLTDHHLVISDESESLFSIECLSLIPYPLGFEATAAEGMMLSLFNTLRSVSTQEGIMYISHRRGDIPAKLISTSYVVSEVGNNTREDDPIVSELPTEDHMIVYQDDTSFRGNFYEYTYWTNSSEIAVRIINRSDMKVFGLFPAVRSDLMSIYVQILPVDEGLLIYSLAIAADLPREISILGYKVNLTNSFTQRLIAVQKWFIDQLSYGRLDANKE